MYIWKRIIRNKFLLISLLVFLTFIVLGIFAPLIAPHPPLETNVEMRYAGPSLSYPLGNDYLGRYMLSRLLYGIRPSFLTILGTLAATAFIGCVLGIISAYVGGKADNVIMRICDIMLTLPGEAMTLAFVGLFGVGLRNILLSYILLTWASFARLIRTSILKYRNSDYVRFSKTLGHSSMHIIFRHIVPSALSEIILITMALVCSMILMISGVSYLGLGIQPPAPEWGAMLFEAKGVMFRYPAQMLIPGIAIVIISLDCLFISDGLRDVLDPQHSKEDRGL